MVTPRREAERLVDADYQAEEAHLRFKGVIRGRQQGNIKPQAAVILLT